MPVMTAKDAIATLWILAAALILWSMYGSNHKNNKWVQVINSFWLGAIVFFILFYIFFSRNQV